MIYLSCRQAEFLTDFLCMAVGACGPYTAPGAPSAPRRRPGRRMLACYAESYGI